MKIGVIQATSQCDKNDLLYRLTCDVAQQYGHQVINFGCRSDEAHTYSYVEIALLISLLLSSKAVDFVVTGCSSGQGMMLACNSLPGILCGMVENPQDAYLFGRINDGNAVSIPLGLNFGWAGEINLQCTLEKLFEDEFGAGYPPCEAQRKKRDAELVKSLCAMTRREPIDVFRQLDEQMIQKMMTKSDVIDYVLAHGQSAELFAFIELHRPFNP